MSILKRFIYGLILCVLPFATHATLTEFKNLDECVRGIHALTDAPYNNQLFKPKNILIIFGIEGILIVPGENWWEVRAQENAKNLLEDLKNDGHPLVFSSPKSPFTSDLGKLFVAGLNWIIELKQNDYPFMRKGYKGLLDSNYFWRDPLNGIEKPIVHITHGLLSSVRMSGEDNSSFNHKAFAMMTVHPKLQDKDSDFSKRINHVILVDKSQVSIDTFTSDMLLLQNAAYLPNLLGIHVFKILPETP